MSEGFAAARPYASSVGRPVETVGRDLEQFAALLLKWNKVQNLVSRETIGELWPRHIADSLQLLDHLQATDRLVLDLGSGGGFPALPLAIASKDLPRRFVLVEPIAKKASFLRTAGRELGLSVKVLDRRAEQIDSRETGLPDVVTSRALAPLGVLLGFGAPFFGPKTRALFHKGREHVEELHESAALWDYDVIVHESRTDAAGVVLEITNLRSRSAP